MPVTRSPDSVRSNSRALCIAALKCGVAAAAMLAVSPSVAFAQEVESVIVTGTSIRGVAPVGANVITVDRSDIDILGATSMNQLIQNVPQISSFGNDGAFFSSNAHTGTGQDAPAIHNLGASSSQSTLILIDGHNFTPTDGYTDPSVIPTIAIQRVDILADGDSAIYGSSAVAGVINYITRTDYEGFQTQLQYSAAQDYSSITASQLWGHRWDNGSAMFAVEYRSAARLSAGNRDFSRSQDLRPFGGTNFMNYDCSPATIAANNAGASSVYAFPYNGAPVAAANNVNAGICDVAAGNSIIPSRTSTSVLFKINQTLSDRLNIGLDMNYASRVQQSVQAQPNIEDSVYGPTGLDPALGAAGRNPFYVAGPLSTASEFVRYNPTALIGPSFTKSGMRAFSGNFRASYDFGGDWVADLNAFAGYNQGYIHSSNRLCTACAHLALNGTTNTTGAANNSIATSAQTDTYLLGTVYNVTRALNTGNALDVWNQPGATNRTSAGVIRELQSDYTDYDENSDLNDVRLKFNGPLFDLWAGPVKVAFGAEYQLIHDHPRTVSSNGIGPSNADSRIIYAPLQRKVQSAFVEFFVPLVSPEMNIPLVQKFDINIAGRYDKYNDVGTTENPRLGFTWDVLTGLKLRGNYGTSFTAPNMQYLSSVVTGSVTTNATVFTVPPDHPAIGAGRICSNPAVPCIFDPTLPGLLTSVGNPDLKPMKGQTYSAGIDFDGGSFVSWMKGFTASVTYWQVKFIGGLTAVTLDQNLNLKGLQNLLQLAPPGGWTLTSPEVQAAIGSNAVGSALPPQIYYIGVNGRRNAFNVWANGIDFEAHYGFSTESWGDFVLGVSGSEKLRFDLQGGPIGSTAPIQDYLNGRNETSTLKATQFNGRASAHWMMDPFDVSLAMNYTNPYWYRTTTFPFNLPTAEVPPGFPPGGFQRIHANITFDLNLAYNLPTDWAWGLTEGAQFSFNVHNLFDQDPPFHNSGFGNFNTYTTGYDQYNASPLGRLITVGLTKKW